jgi:hypothetical protein
MKLTGEKVSRRRHGSMTREQRLVYNAGCASRMQLMRERNKILKEKWEIFSILCYVALSKVSTEEPPLPKTVSTNRDSKPQNPSSPVQYSGGLSLSVQSHDNCSTSQITAYGFHCGNTKITYLNYDGRFAGDIMECKEATAVIDTTGCSDLHRATLQAIKDCRLANVNRLFLMRPTEG